MHVVEQNWQSERSRTEDGIFFGNDEYVPLEGGPDTGYIIGTRRPMAGIISSAPDNWCVLNETVTCRHESSNWIIHAGETSWEGEGFLAVVSAPTGQLLWLLHLSTSEPFVRVETEGDVVRAVSGGYPFRYEWSIPIDAPERFHVESCNPA